MEQEFILKVHGNMSLFEQNQMSGEARAWWVKRIKKYNDDKAAQMQKSSPKR